jgi:hypothetical protein
MLASAPFMEEQFASDNYSGICPEAMEALLQANQGSTPARVSARINKRGSIRNKPSTDGIALEIGA